MIYGAKKIVPLVCVLVVVCIAVLHVHAVDIEGIMFEKGQYTLEDFDGQSVVIAYMDTRHYYGGTLSGSRSASQNAIKDLHARRVQEKLPIQIIVAERSDMDFMMAKIAISNDPIKGVIYARIRNLSSLNDNKANGSVLIQPDGSKKNIKLSQLAEQYAESFGVFPVKGDDLRHPDVRGLWWHFVNGDYSVFKKIMILAGKDNEEAVLLLDRIESEYAQRIRSLLYDMPEKKPEAKQHMVEAVDMFGNVIEKESASVVEVIAIEKTDAPFRVLETMTEYDELAMCIQRVEKSKELKDLLKIAKKHLKKLKKSEVLEDELKAREMFRKTAGPCSGGCRAVWEQYTRGFAAIAKKYPYTVYGELAQQEFDCLDAAGFQSFANNFKSGRF